MTKTLPQFLGALGSQTGSKVVRFFYISLVIQTAGPSVWGTIAEAIVWAVYAQYLIDLGVHMLSTTKNSEDRSLDLIFGRFLVGNRLIIAVLLLLSIYLISHSPLLLYIFFIQLIRALTLDWLLQRKGYIRRLQLIQLIKTSSILALWLFLGKPIDLYKLILLEIIGEALQAMGSWFLSKGSWRFFIPDFKHLRIVFSAFPLFISTFFLILHQNIDVLLLVKLGNHEMAGIYDYSFKIIAFIFFGGGALASIVRARLRASEPLDSIKMIYNHIPLLQAVFFLWWISLNTVGILILEKFSTIPPSKIIPLLQILSVYLLISFHSILLVEWFLNQNMRKKFLVSSISAGIINGSLNAIFIPYWGLIGAAISTIIAEFVILSLLFIWAHQNQLEPWKHLKKYFFYWLISVLLAGSLIIDIRLIPLSVISPCIMFYIYFKKISAPKIDSYYH
jgi:O-antigen/teichoic acid export membrane protein